MFWIDELHWRKYENNGQILKFEHATVSFTPRRSSPSRLTSLRFSTGIAARHDAPRRQVLHPVDLMCFCQPFPGSGKSNSMRLQWRAELSDGIWVALQTVMDAEMEIDYRAFDIFRNGISLNNNSLSHFVQLMLSMTTVLVAACYESHHLCAFVSGSWATWDNQGSRSIESERPGNKILRKKPNSQQANFQSCRTTSPSITNPTVLGWKPQKQIRWLLQAWGKKVIELHTNKWA